MSRTGWVAWVALAAAWVGLVAYQIGHREKALCAPAGLNVVLKVTQNTGNKELGVVYLNYVNAKATRDSLTKWLYQYSQCS